jgi:hypothetical protein
MMFIHFSFTRVETNSLAFVRSGGDDEKAFDETAWSCDYFRDPVIGGFARVRARRVRSEPSSQWLGPVRLGWPERGLVPENDWPSGHAHAQWDIALFALLRRWPR